MTYPLHHNFGIAPAFFRSCYEGIAKFVDVPVGENAFERIPYRKGAYRFCLIKINQVQYPFEHRRYGYFSYDRGKWCSSDPVCYASTGQGTMSLNYAACFACTLLPETSCEFRNVLLDRCSVCGQPEDEMLGLMNWRRED